MWNGKINNSQRANIPETDNTNVNNRYYYQNNRISYQLLISIKKFTKM